MRLAAILLPIAALGCGSEPLQSLVLSPGDETPPPPSIAGCPPGEVLTHDRLWARRDIGIEIDPALADWEPAVRDAARAIAVGTALIFDPIEVKPVVDD